ncbi:MAG TPA: redoxin family protein [Terriglobales bacterium]|nr:redoxin family protein [Terriglobales bacterium]
MASIPLLLLVAIGAHSSGATQKKGQSRSTPNAEMAKAVAAEKAGDFKSAMDHYRKAAESDPKNVTAHKHYVNMAKYLLVDQKMKEWDGAHPELSSSDESVLSRADEERAAHEIQVRREVNSSLFDQYQQWSKKYPNNAIFLWALAKTKEESDPRAAEQYYLKAIEIDPKFADAYTFLSLLQDALGDQTSYRETLRKAVAAFPNDPDFLFYYCSAMEDVDREEFKRLSMEIVEKYPESQRAPQALYWLANSAPTPEEEVRLLELLRKKFPPAKYQWSSNGMNMLFDIYNQIDRSKALALAEDMVKEDPKPQLGPDTWMRRAKYARAMVQTEKLLDDGKPKSALETINTIVAPRNVNGQCLELLRARAVDATGDTGKAYSDLLKNYSMTPTDNVERTLNEYGEKLGKDHSDVESDIWSLLRATAGPATPFSLFNYVTRKSSSLSEFRGQVVLLNFWYPRCGPCRGEFRYIKAVLEKYKSQGFQIIAVNVYPQQDEEVLPLLKGFGLDFIPLKGSYKWAQDVYKIQGEPTNFLIGGDGLIYFGPLGSIHNAETQRTLELQVEALLQHTRTTSVPLTQ